jgi:hypothetical protein
MLNIWLVKDLLFHMANPEEPLDSFPHQLRPIRDHHFFSDE